MKIEGILPQTDNTINATHSNTTCSNEFDIMMQQLNKEATIEEMQKELEEKFNIDIILTEYSCEKTDSEAENHDLSMLKQSDIIGGRNVIISKNTLLRMKTDSRFRRKVYKTIQDIPWQSKTTGGCVKGNGVFIHEDGTGGYYLEFDWGDEEEDIKSKKEKTVYSDNPKEDNFNTFLPDEQNHMEFHTEIYNALAGADFKEKRKK